MKNYELVPYTDADHDNYIKCQMDAFEKYILEFFGSCDMAIMESHLKQLKPNLLKITVRNQTAGYVYYKEEGTKIIVDVFTLLNWILCVLQTTESTTGLNFQITPLRKKFICSFKFSDDSILIISK